MPDSTFWRAEGLTPSPSRAAVESFPGLHKLSLQLNRGEQVALVGPAGSGKTTLLRTLALIHKSAAGQIYFEGIDLLRLPDHKLRPLRQRFQYVGGHPTRSLAMHQTVGEVLREPLDIHRLGSAAERLTRMEAALDAWGLNRWLLGRSVTMLSTTLRQRVALARALILKPRLLISDEVIDHLEPAAAIPVLRHLSALCRAEQVAWLWSTHDADLAQRFADRVLRLEVGQLLPA
ncbi:MAG: ATP-binding cassette domain-containing protein [Anaerolineales bacterium]